MVLSAGCSLAPLHDALDACLKQRHPIGGFDFVFAGASRGGAKKEGAVQRPGGAADMADQDRRHTLKNGADLSRRMGRQPPLSPP